MNLKQLFEDFKGINVGVIGDVMLDTYMWGHVERISPEAPVPVVSVSGKEYRIGGAGNVALNLASLGAKASIISITGIDDAGKQLKQMFTDQGVNTEFLSTSDVRITTNKTRIISRNQQMMRLDSEMTQDLTTLEEDQLINVVKKYIHSAAPAVIIFEDYNKGVLTARVIKEIIALCKANSIVTAVDPKRKNFFTYEGVDIFKPNLKEVKEGLNIIDEAVTASYMDKIHDLLHKKLQHNISFITLSEHGAYFNDGKKRKLIPSHRRNIADVSGAGDTVIAVASLVYAVTKDIELMGEMANIAGGLVCEEVGTVAIQRDRLYEECLQLLVRSDS